LCRRLVGGSGSGQVPGETARMNFCSYRDEISSE
jgi:hypothetical protein